MLAVQQPGLMLAPSVDASHSPNRPYEGKGCSIDSLSNRHKFKNVWPDPCFMGVFHCRWGFNRILHCHVKLLLVAASNYFINPGKKTLQGGNLPKPSEPSWRQNAILRALHLMGFMLCMPYPSLVEPILMPATTWSSCCPSALMWMCNWPLFYWFFIQSLDWIHYFRVTKLQGLR